MSFTSVVSRFIDGDFIFDFTLPIFTSLSHFPKESYFTPIYKYFNELGVSFFLFMSYLVDIVLDAYWYISLYIILNCNKHLNLKKIILQLNLIVYFYV